jgi:hypothetical protein
MIGQKTDVVVTISIAVALLVFGDIATGVVVVYLMLYLRRYLLFILTDA